MGRVCIIETSTQYLEWERRTPENSFYYDAYPYVDIYQAALAGDKYWDVRHGPPCRYKDETIMPLTRAVIEGKQVWAPANSRYFSFRKYSLQLTNLISVFIWGNCMALILWRFHQKTKCLDMALIQRLARKSGKHNQHWITQPIFSKKKSANNKTANKKWKPQNHGIFGSSRKGTTNFDISNVLCDACYAWCNREWFSTDFISP